MADYMEAIKAIKKGNISQVYLLTGENEYLKNQMLLLINKTHSDGSRGELDYQKMERIESLRELVMMANSVPLFSTIRLLHIKDERIFKPSLFSEGEYNILFDYLQSPNPATCMVFYAAPKVDKRSKLYKKLHSGADVVECETLKGTQLIRWINQEFSRRGKKADSALLASLAEASKGDMFFLSNEIEKITLFVDCEEVISLQNAKPVLTKTLDAIIFSLIDYVVEKKSKLAIQELNELLAMNESPILINYMLSKQFRLLLNYVIYRESGWSESEIQKAFNIKPFVFRKVSRQATVFNKETLIKILGLFIDVDRRLKYASTDPANLLSFAVLAAIKQN